MIEVPFHYQFRVIVIGDTMVGKSSLLKTFSEGSFGELEPTVGVDFFSKTIEIKPTRHRSSNQSQAHPELRNSANNNVIIKLQIWDTAGQERFRSIVTSYYRNSIGIILVYDVTNRESYDHLIDWFTEARRHIEPTPSPTLSPITHHPPFKPPNLNSSYPLTSTPNNFHRTGSRYDEKGDSVANRNLTSFSRDTSRQVANNSMDDKEFHMSEDLKMVYLVLGCKTDLAAKRQVSYEDGLAFADLHGFKFIETSSKTNHNVDKAFQILAEEIYDKIKECGRARQLHRTASGGHLTFDGTSQLGEGIRLGPLLGNHSSLRLSSDVLNGNVLEAQPVPGLFGGCC